VTKHRSPHNRSSDAGFTAIELLAGLVIIGILLAIAIPNIASMYKPLSTAVSSTTSQLTLIRSKAMASSRAYRIRPKSDDVDRIPAPNIYTYANKKPNELIVEYNKGGGTCNQNDPREWGAAPQFDFKLSDRIVLGNIPVQIGGSSASNYLAWDETGVSDPDGSAPTATDPARNASSNKNSKYGLCFDSRGIPRKTVEFWLVDEQGSSQAKSAKISVNGTGGVSYTTYSNASGTGAIPGNKF
jgi:prepilin-type N-terminal cleavage/methylation domain-containing protein